MAEIIDKVLTPWGHWQKINLYDFKHKYLVISPDKKISLQIHRLRHEVWIVVYGRGRFTIGDKIQIGRKGDHFFVPLGTKHRIHNISYADELVLMEIQFGPLCSEEDIVRLEDDYGRTIEKSDG